ncbi:phospholipase A-2-activating protein [Cryptococcus wingfieldii CBS 7118]|uniref:Phospholipase A-2-activating protein n=1 Tax=Cryptococcus wingfieldii CBS 7118 TaxID=1295528 RepID=A0A1E3K5Q2_9TREE|nr:phospholipase A-2-activating protein [Cryptococcus wingfieldii CBS 7118]ODO08391.1 phospholipase A-2-activating protein [Cryptococcus wingfieldii CBS 7118]
MSAPYKLAFSLHGHAADVRHVATPNAGIPLLLSASRDGSALVWGPSTTCREWDVKLRVEGPEKRYLSCAALTRSHGAPYLLVGSQSGILASYPLPAPASAPPAQDELPEPVHTLIEHSQNLCCIDVSHDGLVATGSWDKSVIVWKDFKKALSIKAHEQAIWSVKFVGEDRLLTASADNRIILHSLDLASGRSTPLQTYTGHTQPVRGLALRPDGQGFWSCSNDGNINIYSFDKPAPINTLSGHTSFVYSITALPDGSGAISTGEDGTMRVWSDSELVQTIPHTSNSLWSCTTAPPPPSSPSSGPYIVSSSSDSTIRFFTNSPELVAPEEELAVWDAEVKGRQLDKSQVGDVKHSDLPGMEALGREGKKDGQVLMINNNGQVEAYQWSTPESTWQQIGQVVDAIGQSRKQLYQGKEYDYVFDVDVSEGMPPLKLPYNTAQNPWIAAQTFLQDNELPGSYLDQVVQFIEKNTAGQTLGGGEAQGYVDPFTGGSRYTGGGVPMAGGQANNADPFTGGSRYTGGGVPTHTPSYGGGDPFTSSGAYSSTPPPASTPAAKKQKQAVLPVKSWLAFKQINVAAVKGKVAQFNEQLKGTGAELTTDENKALTEVYAFLSLPSVALPNPEGGDGQEKFDPNTLTGIISRWPEDKRFPLVDLLRALSATSPATSALSPAIITQTLQASSGPLSKPQDTNLLLTLRALANKFNTSSGRGVLNQETVGQQVLTALGGISWQGVGKNSRVAAATVALNYSISAQFSLLPSSLAPLLLDLVIAIISTEKVEGGDTETVYRAAVAFGNLISADKVSGGLAVGKVEKGRAVVKKWTGKEPRLGELGREIEEKLSQGYAV